MIPDAPTEQAPQAVEVRHYASVADFQVDVASMASAGWHVVAQSEATGGANAAWAVLGAIVLVVSILFFIPGVLVAVLLFIASAVIRGKTMVVTYRPQ